VPAVINQSTWTWVDMGMALGDTKTVILDARGFVEVDKIRIGPATHM